MGIYVYRLHVVKFCVIWQMGLMALKCFHYTRSVLEKAIEVVSRIQAIGQAIKAVNVIHSFLVS